VKATGMTGRVQVIVNPVSGRGGGLTLARRLQARLTAMGGAVELHVTRSAGDAAEIAVRATPEVYRAMVVVGGDGTVREVVTSGTSVPTTILPTGTENLIARQLRLRPDPNCVIGLLRFGKVVALDLADVKGTNGRSRLSVAVVGAGFDADVVRRVTETRRGHIDYTSYFWPTWRTFWSHRFPPLRVETEDGPVFEGRGLVFVGCMSRYALGLRILQHAIQYDRKLDVCVFECGGRLRLLTHAIRTALRRHTRSPHVVYRQAKWVRVASTQRVETQVDGDLADALPAEFTLSDKRALLLAPPDWRGG
jgi:diacylglycerol kinase (ATP)